MTDSRVERYIDADPDAVVEVLKDGWSYASWVVGTCRVRGVDASWPMPGTEIAHSVGTWPLTLSDRTRSLAWEPGRRLRLRARGWPLGEAEVELTVRPEGRGSVVTIDEDAVAGPGALVPAPVRHVLIKTRNVETLRRLAMLAEAKPARVAEAADS